MNAMYRAAFFYPRPGGSAASGILGVLESSNTCDVRSQDRGRTPQDVQTRTAVGIILLYSAARGILAAPLEAPASGRDPSPPARRAGWNRAMLPGDARTTSEVSRPVVLRPRRLGASRGPAPPPARPSWQIRRRGRRPSRTTVAASSSPTLPRMRS